MDDVVGTGPEEHLMRDFERIWLRFKTKRDLQASVCPKISVVIWCVLCLIHGCSLTRFP